MAGQIGIHRLNACSRKMKGGEIRRQKKLPLSKNRRVLALKTDVRHGPAGQWTSGTIVFERNVLQCVPGAMTNALRDGMSDAGLDRAKKCYEERRMIRKAHISIHRRV